MALTVVTAIYGSRYRLYEPAEAWPDCEFVCFTDRLDFKSRYWSIKQLPLALSPRRSNRHVKALLHRYVTGPTLYIDADFKLIGKPQDLVGNSLDVNCWSATRHPYRDCLFDEAEYCAVKGLISSTALLTEQLNRYRAAGMPTHYGLWAGGILARRGDRESEHFGENWWHEIQRGVERDQVSLPFVVWRFGVPPGEIAGTYTSLPGLIHKSRK